MATLEQCRSLVETEFQRVNGFRLPDGIRYLINLTPQGTTSREDSGKGVPIGFFYYGFFLGAAINYTYNQDPQITSGPKPELLTVADFRMVLLSIFLQSQISAQNQIFVYTDLNN